MTAAQASLSAGVSIHRAPQVFDSSTGRVAQL